MLEPVLLRYPSLKEDQVQALRNHCLEKVQISSPEEAKMLLNLI
jgi:hypothetical protein